MNTTQVLTIFADVNSDGVLNILDLVLVASNFGQTGENAADLNDDGVVDLLDLYLMGNILNNINTAPSVNSLSVDTLTAAQVQEWLTDAKQQPFQFILNTEEDLSSYQSGIDVLEQILQSFAPIETALLANYPNPFNPETWIPFQLSTPSDVTVSIHAADGTLVRKFDLGNLSAGTYQNKNRAAYWDGKNEFGESVASGVFFYTLTAAEFSATRKMLILK